MTPYTSFLVLETEEDYRKHNIPLRNGATAEGVPRNWEKVIEEYKSRRSDTTSIADEWEKGMREFQGREQVRREEAEHMAQEHYRIAERFFQEGRLESAELACREALTLNPGHAGARALQYETQLLMGRGKAAPQSERLEKAIRQTEARQKEVQQEIDEQFNLGMRHYNAGNYGDAERSFRLILAHAKWVFPPNAEIDARRQQAAEMLEKTRKAETQRDLDNGRTMDRQIATIKGQIIETMIRIRAGERFLAAREYEKALAEFEEAEVQILAMPEQVPEKGSFLPVVKEYKKRTKDAIDEHVKIHLENERKKNEEIQKIQPDRDIEIDRYRDHIGKIIAEKNSSIQELQYLRKELERASHDMISPEGAPVKDKRRVEEAVEELRRRGTDSPKGPSAEPIEFPDRIAWQKASRRAREGVLRSIEEMEEPETVTDVGRKLHSKKVDMNCTDEPLENVLAFLREHTGLIILVDPEAGIDLKQPAGLKVKQASAWSALNHLLQQIDAQATITEDKVIMITRPPMTQPADQIDRLLKTLERGTLREQQDAIRRLVEAAKSDIPVEPALRALDGVTRFAPDVPEHWFLLARVYRKAGMPAQARRAALTPIEMQPEDPTLRAQIVQALKEIGEMGAACAELRNLCRLRPDEPGPHFELARMEIDRKNWPAAEDGYLQLIRRGVAVDEARADLAELYRKMASAGGVKIDALRDRMDPLVRALLFRDVKITLTWDLAPDVDLWVTAPGDELCKHTHLRTSRGGRLQRDILGGRGPEIYTFPDALPGRWLIQVRLFTGARAAGKVEIVLFEGTPEERRASIPFVLEREKETVTLLDGELPR
jgi:tetratricopeptide (TPR) repeat protein